MKERLFCIHDLSFGQIFGQEQKQSWFKTCPKSMFTELCPAQLQWSQYPAFAMSPGGCHSRTMVRTNHNRQDNCKKITTLLQYTEKFPLSLASLF